VALIFPNARTEGSEHVAVFAACALHDNWIAAELSSAHCVLSPHNNAIDRDICIMFGCRCNECESETIEASM
jgi:hypothetical protein